MLISPIMALRIYQIVRSELLGNDESIIIHVHDYELLISAVFLRYLLPALMNKQQKTFQQNQKIPVNPSGK